MALLTERAEIEYLGNGRHRQTLHIKPIAYYRDGSLRRITNTLGNSGDPNLTIGVDERFQFRIRDRLSGQAPLMFFGRGQSSIRLTPLNTNNISGIVSGNGITFPEAWNNADLRYIMAGHRLQKDISLRTGHPQKFEFRIDDSVGLNLDMLASADIRLLDPVLIGPRGEFILLKWLVSSQGGKTILTAVLPEGDFAGWTLDPTFTDGPSGNVTTSKDDGMSSGVPTRNNGVNTTLLSGSVGRGLIEFDLSSIDSGATCDNATFYAYQVGTTSALAWTITFYSIAVGNAAWIEGTKNNAQAGAGEPCWNALAADGAGGVTTAWAGSAGLSTSGTDYEADSLGSVAGNRSDADGTPYPVALTAARVAGWFGSPNTNYGLLLVPTVHPGGWGSSDHATAGYRPKLVVEYTTGGGASPSAKSKLALLGVGT